MSKPVERVLESPVRRFPAYPEYKDSGILWLGKVPEHWELGRLKRLVGFVGGGTPAKDVLEYWSGDIPWASPKDMKSRIISDTEDKITSDAVAESATRLVPKGSVLLVVRSGILQHSIPVALNGTEVALNQDLKALIPGNRIFAPYLAALIEGNQAPFLIEWRKEGATVESLELDLIKNSVLPIPPISEQQRIVTFLDRETAKLDSLIAKKERLIDLLQEKRTTLTTQAVTKGLNPIVPTRDSGVEWLDRVPSHWTGLPLKRWVAVKITDGPHETPQFEDSGVQFISAEALVDGRIDFAHRRGFISQKLHEEYCQKCRPMRGDILICKSGATTGKIAMVQVDFEFSIWSPLALVRAKDPFISPKFLSLTLQSDYVQNQIKRTWSAGTQPNISMGDLENLFIVAPGIEEQADIVNCLMKETDDYNAILPKVREGIDRLKELRTALISAAVTGQIDIRGGAP